MNGKEYLNNIRAEEMSKEELQKEIKKLYEDNWAISNQCDTLEQMLSAKVKNNILNLLCSIFTKMLKNNKKECYKVDYDKEFIREKIVRKYANSDIFGFNIYSDRHDIEFDYLYFSEVNYLPVDFDRMIAEVEADNDLMPIHIKIMAKIAIWFEDCVNYLRGIWGITN